MLSPRATLSLSLLAVAVLSMGLRVLLLGPLDGSKWLLTETTLLITLVGSVSSVWIASTNKLRGKGERLALTASLLVTSLVFAGAVWMVCALCALASP